MKESIHEAAELPTWRVERTNWRDQELSKRHGAWGFNCPAVDLDFVMMEYNHARPVALVEYKHKNAKEPNIEHATYRALVDLADGYRRRALPCFIASYDPADWSFRIVPLNQRAKTYYSRREGQTLSEQDFVRSLHLLRTRTLSAKDEEAISRLNKTCGHPNPS